MRTTRYFLIGMMLTMMLLLMAACGGDDSSATADGDTADGDTEPDGDADGDLTDGDTNQCPNGFAWDEAAGRCTPAKPTCPSGFHYDNELGRCVPGAPDCPPGFEWDADNDRCTPASQTDGDEEPDGDADQEEEPQPEYCWSNYDCPWDRECGEDRFCSEWSEGQVAGWVESLVYSRKPNSYKSAGRVWGKYRGEGIIIGYGTEAWTHLDDEFGEAVSFVVIDLLSDILQNHFLLTIRKDLVVSETQISYNAADMRGYLIRATVDDEDMSVLSTEYMGQVLAGEIRFGHINLENYGRLNSEFSFYIGPVLDTPEE